MSEGPRRPASPQKPPRVAAKTGSASTAASQLFDDLMLSAWQSLPDATPNQTPPSATNSPTSTDSENQAAVATIAKMVAALPAVQAPKQPAPARQGAATPMRSTVPAVSRPVPVPPANASSSDDKVLRRVADCLAGRNIASFTRIGLDVKRGVITIRGDVASKGERLLLLHLLQKIPGVVQVNDGLSIVHGSSSVPSRGVLSQAAKREGVSFSWPDFSEWRPSAITALIAVAVLLVGSLAYSFWPSGPARPVAVHPVKGRAVLEGQPMSGANITLHPSSDSKVLADLRPRGTVTADGSFVLSTFDQADGAPSGDFIVTVFWSKPVIVDGETQVGPSLISAAYAKPESSPLRITIKPDTEELPTLELKKLPSRPQSRVVPAYLPE